MKTVKIGGGQGFYGDTPLPALEMARKVDNLNYIGFDCLSEPNTIHPAKRQET